MRACSSEPTGNLFLGLECGGTRTVALLASDYNRSQVRLEAGPANMRLMSDHQLISLFRGVASRLPRPLAVGIGMAGVLEEAERARVRAAVTKAWPGLPCWAGNDLETALAAAEGPGTAPVTRVIIICGTGSCCYGRNPSGAIARTGGWGHLLGDRGSAYAIGLQALRAIIRSCDDDGQWPLWAERFMHARLINNQNQLVTWAQNASKAEIAAVAIDVFQGAAQGETIARRVVQEAAETLAEDGAACAAHLARRGTLVEFLLTGSVLLKQPSFAAAVRRGLQRRWPKATVKPLRREGAWGAVAYAMEEWKKSHLSPAPREAGSRGRESAPSFAEGSQPRLTSAATNRESKARVDSRNALPGAEAYPLPSSSRLSPTEQRNPRSRHLDRLPLAKAIRLMLHEDARIPAALWREQRSIERGLRFIAQSLRSGGRLFYVGAGTSGRLGVLDASECPPTFGTSPELVQGIMAGGSAALWSSIEGAEDDAEAGAQAVRERKVNRKDVVVGIAASGRTPFVWGALHAAKQLRARTILLCFNPYLKISRAAAPTVVIAPEVGPEVLTGSTRLKAGTATKLLLNMFSTLAMVQCGKVVQNLMVDLNPSNTKLRDRAVRIVMDLTGAARVEAEAALEKSGWVVKRALARLGGTRRRHPLARPA
jgi:N-acetylmuramic acid 6-phosphate etherase